MVIKKGLSEVIGFLIILIILVAILVPLTLLYFSQPSIQQEQIESVQAYKNLATQQFRDLDSIPFIYNSTTNAVYFVFIGNSSPPIPLVIKELAIFNGKEWVMQNVSIDVTPGNANTMYFGYPAIEIPLSATPYDKQPSYVATVTQYGNIIYASSIDPALLRNNNNGNTGIIIFPYYHDYGLPLDPSVLNMEFPFCIPPNNQDYPNWGVLDGIASPSAISLVPVNVTIGDPTTYNWAITDAELAFYPNSSTGWINITYYDPMIGESYTVKSVPDVLFSGFTWTLYGVGVSGCVGGYANFEWYQSNGTVGVYIPLNISATIATYPYSTGSVENITVYQYSFIYFGNTEVYNFHIGNFFYYVLLNSPNMSAWTYTQIGTLDIQSILYYFPSYLISSNPQNVFGINVMPIDFPPINWYSSNSYFNYINFSWGTVHTNFYDNTLGVHTISGQQYPIQVFQVDINLHKGEVLDYGYYSGNNSWLLLYNWTFNYNNQSLYREAIENLGPLSGGVFIDNINNIEYLTEYPVYIVVPSGVYLLQVSTN